MALPTLDGSSQAGDQSSDRTDSMLILPTRRRGPDDDHGVRCDADGRATDVAAVIGGSGRRIIAPVFLVLLVSACSRNLEVERPAPHQVIESVVLHSGDTIDFAARERATLEDSVIVVRSARRAPITRIIPAREVETFVIQQLDGAATFGVILGLGLVFTLMVVTSLGAGYSGG